MQSEGQTFDLSNPQALNASVPPQWRETGEMPLRPANDIAARIRWASLAQEHRDLDDLIAVLSDANACDEALITRLKKRKLHIKDEMARLVAA